MNLAFLRSSVRALAATLVLAFALVRPAQAYVDWTDIWWAPPEVGAGYNMVLSDSFMFITFFVHGANLEPDWYTGQMSVDANGNWAGGLYRTTGSYFAGPYKPGDTNTVQVGNVSFTPSSASAGVLAYNVGAVNVSRAITRLTLTNIALGGTYLGGVVAVVTGCSNPNDNGVFRTFIDLAVTQITNGALTFDVTLQDAGACKFTGNYSQDGQLFRVPNAAYTCGAFSSTANLTQIKSTQQGIEFQWAAGVGGGCTETGYVSAVLR